MTRIEKPILYKDEYREQTVEEATETFHLAAKELKSMVTPIVFMQELMKVAPMSEVKGLLSDLQRGKY